MRYIYENACYAFYDLDDETACRYKIDRAKFFKKQAFIEFTIDDYMLEELPADAQKQNLSDVNCLIRKEYNRGYFFVQQTWTDWNGEILKRNRHKFSFFFSFVYFLKGDLSDADLISCDGLANLSKECGIDFSRAKLTSFMCDKASRVLSKMQRLQKHILNSWPNNIPQKDVKEPVLLPVSN